MCLEAGSYFVSPSGMGRELEKIWRDLENHKNCETYENVPDLPLPPLPLFSPHLNINYKSLAITLKRY